MNVYKFITVYLNIIFISCYSMEEGEMSARCQVAV